MAPNRDRTRPLSKRLWLRARLAVAVASCLIGCDSGAPSADRRFGATTMATSTAVPAQVPGTDGSIASLKVILGTAHSKYHALTYLSDGLRAMPFLGRPCEGSALPTVILNRSGYGEFGALWGPEIIFLVEAGCVAAASQYPGTCGGDGHYEF